MSWTNTLKLTLESSSVVAGLQAIVQGAGKASSAVGGIATAATAAGAKMLSAFKGVGDILFKLPDQVRALQGMLDGLSLPSKLAGSAETTQVAFSVLVGSAEKAQQVLGRIRSLAAETPFEFPELADSARKLAAFGEAADAIPDTLRRIGDIAAGTQSSISELAAIYGKARVAGTLYAEDINQLTERGIPVLQQFAAQLGVAVDQVKKLAADGQISFPLLEQAFKNLTSSGGQFAGMMEQISATFEGKMSTLKDSFSSLLGAMGKGINEGLKPVLDDLTELLDGQQGLAQQIGDSIGQGIETAMNVIKNGDQWTVLENGLAAAAALFTAELAKGIMKAGEVAVKTVQDKAEWLNGATAARKAYNAIFGEGDDTAVDEDGVDALNAEYRRKQQRLMDSLQPAMDMTDAARAGRANRERQANALKANEAGLKSYQDKQESEAKAIDQDQANRDAALESFFKATSGGMDKKSRDAKADADARAAAVEAAGGEEAYRRATDSNYRADKEAEEETRRLVGDAYYNEHMGIKSPDVPAPKEVKETVGIAPTRTPDVAQPQPAIPNAGTGGRRKIRGAKFARGAASGLGDMSGPSSYESESSGSGKITGAPYAKGAASGLGDVSRRVGDTTHEDRMAGMANNSGNAAKAASEAAENASKATVMLIKLLPEIEKHTRRTANNTDSK